MHLNIKNIYIFNIFLICFKLDKKFVNSLNNTYSLKCIFELFYQISFPYFLIKLVIILMYNCYHF